MSGGGKASPEPWGINDDGDVVDEGGELVAIDPRHGLFPASLIAAAPELYEALGICVATAECALKASMNLKGQSPYDIAMEALRKARGEAA